jgi:hypothetical protein
MPAATFPITVADGSSQTVHNIASGSACTVSETLPVPPTTGCSAGNVPTWFTPPVYSPASVNASSGAGPTLTVTNTLNCAPPSISGLAPPTCDSNTTSRKGNICACHFENMQRVSAAACGCADGMNLVPGKGCVRLAECKPPMIPGAVAGACVCPSGTVQKGRECVRPIACNAPAVPNRAGTACVCPAGFQAQGKGCVKVEERRPAITPGDIIRVLPGLINPGGDRGSPSREPPGRGSPGGGAAPGGGPGRF